MSSLVKKIFIFLFFIFFSQLFFAQTLSDDSDESVEPDPSVSGESLLEELEKGNSRGIREQGEENKITEIPEFVYSDREGFLRRFSYDGEGLSVEKNKENVSLSRAYGKNFVRKNFDEKFRLKKTENIFFGNDINHPQLISQTEYFYKDDEIHPFKKIEEITESKTKIETLFDLKGNEIKVSKGHFETDEKNEEKQNWFYDSIVSCKYNSEDKVIEINTESYHYNTNSYGKRILQKTISLYNYEYNKDESIPADYSYTEDGKLRLKRSYAASDSYVERVYFNDDFSVESRYENGKKTEEIVYMNNKETRRRKFE